MALLSVTSISETTMMGLWRIEETVEDFYAQYPFLTRYRGSLERRYASDGRKREFLAVHALLREVMGHDVEMTHLPSGKPVVAEGQVSVSHTKGYAAIVFSPVDTVAIDIEYVSERVNRVAHRFIREDEEAGDLYKRLILWSAKETAYKFFSEDNLLFYDMRVFPFAVSDKVCKLENRKRGCTLDIHFELTGDYVLTYAHDSIAYG